MSRLGTCTETLTTLCPEVGEIDQNLDSTSEFLRLKYHFQLVQTRTLPRIVENEPELLKTSRNKNVAFPSEKSHLVDTELTLVCASR